VRNYEELHNHPTLGSSWEGFVIEQIIGIAPPTWETYFYRTAVGAEVDLLLISDQNDPIAIEIKYSLSPKASRGFWSSLEDLQCRKGFIIYPGEDSYPVSNEVDVLPLKNIQALFNGGKG
jgi:predicted AAA+ superfamily ATPase